MTKEILRGIENDLCLVFGNSDRDNMRRLIAAVRERDERIAKLRTACEQALVYDESARGDIVKVLKETESP